MISKRHILRLIVVTALLSCSEQNDNGYPEWLTEYDATFVLPDVTPTNSAIPPCTCYLSPDGKPIVWIKKKSLVDTLSTHTIDIESQVHEKGGNPMDP